MTRAGGFTLIEMLVATVLAAVLIAAELAIASRLSRDRQIVAAHVDPTPPRGTTDLLHWELSQADRCELLADGSLRLVGHNSIAPSSLLPDFHYVRVDYRIDRSESIPRLIRHQEALDDPTRSGTFDELIVTGARAISVQPTPDASGQLAASGTVMIETSSAAISAEWAR